MIGQIETIGTGLKSANCDRNNGLASVSKARRRVTVKDREEGIEPCEADDAEGLRKRFVTALTVSLKADVTLGDVVRDMIEQGIERDEAIDWGIEAGLPESSVRTKVSQIYSEVQGRVRAKGAGRKSSMEAVEYAAKLIKDCKGDLAKAKKLALAVYRQVEKAAKEASK